MKTLINLIFVILTLGCIEPLEFHVDKNCSSDEKCATIEAFNELNEVLGYEHAVVIGSEEIDFERISDYNEHVVVCIQDEQQAKEANIPSSAGWYNSGDVYVRSDKTTNRYGIELFQKVVMHELIHFLGAKPSEHLEGEEDIFNAKYNADIQSVEYTESDKQIIKKYSME